MKLNLGCGDLKRPGYVNEVRAEHFLEHVDDYSATILEIHRILKPGGILWFRVPHFRNPMSVWHLHTWAFSTCTPNYLCQALPYQWGGKALFDKLALRINFANIPDRNGFNRFVKRLLSAAANHSTLLWDWLGLPIDEIEFKGRKR